MSESPARGLAAAPVRIVLIASAMLILGLSLACCSSGLGPQPDSAVGDEDATAGQETDSGDETRAEEDQGPNNMAGTLDPVTEGQHTYLIGHSLVNEIMPSWLQDVARSQDLEHTYSAYIGIGAALHWLHNEGGGEGAHPNDALPREEWDVLVMTEALDIRDNYQWGDTVRYAGIFLDRAREGNPDVQAYFYETWHQRANVDWDFRQRIDDDREVWEAIVDEVNEAHPNGRPMLLVPGGTALGQLVDRIRAGTFPGIDDIDDLYSDNDVHMNDVGNYFIACVMYATIYRRSPVGATNRSREGFDAPSEETARALQELAWEVVSRDPRAGVARFDD